MALESLQAAQPAPATAPRPKHCYRLRFRKAGDLRLVSHIDLMHVFERLLRRAAVPFASTQGFHPKPCLVFAQALALGVAGLNEAADLELTAPLPEADLLAALNRHAPPGLVFHSVNALPRKGSLNVRRAFYRLPLPTPVADLPARCADLLARPNCIVERARPRRRRINIHPYLHELQATDQALTMSLWITPNGAARPEEVVHALGLGALLDAGAVLERTGLELMDDLPENERRLPEIPWLQDAEVRDARRPPENELVTTGPAGVERAPTAEPLISTPMSFDT